MGQENPKELKNPLSLTGKARSFRPSKKEKKERSIKQESLLNNFQTHMEETLGIVIPELPTADELESDTKVVHVHHHTTETKIVEVVEPEEEIIEEAITEEDLKPKTQMEELADKVATLISRPEEDPIEENDSDAKIKRLERSVTELREMIREVGHVASSNATSPGSGEVWLKRLDDVDVRNAADGSVLTWDATLERWIPSTVAGGGDTYTLTRDVSILLSKMSSLEEDVLGINNELGLFLRLEENTTGVAGDPIGVNRSEYIDTIPDGDTTRFVVGQGRRGVYTLDGVPQPTVEVPRGDILEFDTSELADESKFDIYADGSPMEESSSYSRSEGLIRVNTSHINSSITRLYYRDTQTTGLGWVIVITDY